MIISRQNALVKKIRSLSDKKNRAKFGEYVAEGIKTVNEAIITGQNVVCIVGTSQALSKTDARFYRTEEVSEEIFKYISEEVNPQGVLAIIKTPEIALRPPTGSCIFLDGVSDPSNVGAIIRTAAAAGYNDVYLANSADPYNGKAVRASMSGIFRVNAYIGDREELSDLIKLPVAIADMNGENVFETRISGEFCLVVGNEANGVSDFMRDKAAFSVKIPMENGMESLNAAVSAGILMYELKNGCKL